tara:strand:- start:37 stop:246 length:210 start_codon:yes stop_codon:yes gene_type:complete
MKKMLISCINDEKIVSPPAYVQPNANAKKIIENGIKYFEVILSISFTFCTIPILPFSFCFYQDDLMRGF